MLSENPKSHDCKVKESKERGVYVENLTTVPLKNTDDFVGAYDFILRNINSKENSVAKKSNKASKIMIFNIETCNFDEEGLKESFLSKLYLCDMMASNKSGKDHHSHSASIGSYPTPSSARDSERSANGSFPHIVQALTDRKSKFIPYKDSKFTRLM
mmetsp:Transcript_32978/g.29853  ORF Transcript_32978/g.29853 Transcript_32978/m.29853 type:complete len:157 (-) Transcript_32978:2049-2519(-)